MNSRSGVDIIVPVYNALNDVKLCVDSIRKHTDLSLDRLILIDDRSPDENVFPYLKSLEGEGIVVLQNEKNLGFSGTVNQGLCYSDRDVILQNSDTIVTRGWVDKIVECAYSAPAIGTVTPFSNNATLCSIPNFCQENTIPNGLSIDEYAEIIEKTSLKRYPRITVAVGFCMYIKREVINLTGLFDAATFQRGYGEENDFCWRAEQLGYYHVLCDTTYIYHSGSASFVSEEKMQLMRDHAEILEGWYPKQMHSNDVYVRDNPHQYVRTNVEPYVKIKNGKKNILFILHLDFRKDAENNIGGTQFHVKDLVEGLHKEKNVFVLVRAGEYLNLTVYLEQEYLTYKFYIGKRSDFITFSDKEIAKVYRNILSAFSIDMVHIHHINGLSFDFFPITKEFGIPLVMTMHDFSYICPTITLLENGTAFCGGVGNNCAKCLNKQMGYTERVDFIPLWQSNCRKAMGMCDLLITPSESAKKIYAKVYPELENRIKVISHGKDNIKPITESFLPGKSDGLTYSLEKVFDGNNIISGWVVQENIDSKYCDVILRVADSVGNVGEYWAMPVHRGDLIGTFGSDKYMYSGFSVQIPDAYFKTGPLTVQLYLRHNNDLFHSETVKITNYKEKKKKKKRIAFLGGLYTAKGSHLAYEIMSGYGNKYDWYLIGGMGDPDLVALEKSNITKLGWYRQENVEAMLQQYQIDLVCILSLCAETFCYTLSEAQLAGVPCLVTDIGALGERMHKDKTGWLVRTDISAKELLETIDSIFEEEKYSEMRDRVKAFKHNSVEYMVKIYSDLYDSLDMSCILRKEFDSQLIFTGYAQGSAERMSSCNMQAGAELIQRLNELEAQLNVINESVEYKLVRFFNRERVPFKRQIKWLLGVAYRFYKKYFKK